MGNFCNWCCGIEDTTQRCPENLLEEVKAQTALSYGQIEHLYQRFLSIADYNGVSKPPPHLHKRHFLSVGHFRSNPLFATILTSMFGQYKKTLNFVDFATYLALFDSNKLTTKQSQIAANKEEKIRLLFNMYDEGRNGAINKDDLIRVTHLLFASYLPASYILKIVAIMLEEMDTTNTQQILFDDFRQSLLTDFDMEEVMVTRIPER